MGGVGDTILEVDVRHEMASVSYTVSVSARQFSSITHVAVTKCMVSGVVEI
jgi:hypothetical protein